MEKDYTEKDIVELLNELAKREETPKLLEMLLPCVAYRYAQSLETTSELTGREKATTFCYGSAYWIKTCFKLGKYVAIVTDEYHLTKTDHHSTVMFYGQKRESGTF